MNSIKMTILSLLFFTVVSSMPQHYGYPGLPADYVFKWGVRDEYSGNNYGHSEARDGDRTEGSYFVHLPDGRLQKVKYYVTGDSGFVAEVTYEGVAVFPEPQLVSGYKLPSLLA